MHTRPSNALKKKKLFFLLSFLTGFFFVFSLSAQDIYSFRGLRSSGELSDDFVVSSTEKYISQSDSILDGKRNSTNKITDDFLLKSNFILDEMLLSGSVLANDEVGKYVNEVLDVVLQGQPDLRKDISVYITKAPEVNAFATDRGVVLVNLGLFNKIENEAQLAAILAHEVTHFDERHNLSSRLKAYEIANGKGTQKVRTIDGFLLRKHAYDRSLEYEADLKGAERMKSTNYELQSILDVFDVLEDSRNPYKYVLSKVDQLDLEGMLISDGIQLNLALIDSLMTDQKQRFSELNDEDQDLYSTHPAVEKRKIAIADAIGERSLTAGKPFLVSEERFLKCQQMARLEMGRMLNNKGNFSEAIYHSMLLNEDLPDHPYNMQGLTAALYAYTIDRLNSSVNTSGSTISISIKEEKGPADDNSYTMDWETIPVAQFKKSLLKLNSLDLVSLTYALAQKMEDQYPEDALYPRVKELLVRQLIKKYNFEIDGGIPKFDEPSKWSEMVSHDYFKRLTRENDFQTAYETARREESVQNDHLKTYAPWFLSVNVEGFKTAEFAEKGGNDLLLLSPVYRTSKSVPNGTQYLPIESEKKQREMVKTFREMDATIPSLHLEVLDPKSEEDKNAERFNESMLLSEWMSRIDDDNNYPITADYQEVLNILSRRNVNNVGQLSFVYFEEPKFRTRKKIGRVALGTIFPFPLNVLQIVRTFKKRKYLISYKLLVDVESGVISWSEVNMRSGSKDHLPYIIQSTENYINEIKR